MIQQDNQLVYFEKDNIRYLLSAASEEQIDEMMKYSETGFPRFIVGYPLFYSPSGRLYPLPTENIELIYE